MTMDLANQTTLEHPFNGDLHHKVTLLDADGNVVHRWQHIPVGHMMSSEFIIPCDENVTLNLHSDKYGDKNGIYQGVQHSFWLQEWGNKEDLVPGLEGGTWMYVQPNEAGTFPVRCAEYCGEMHSLMRGEVEVVAREEVEIVTKTLVSTSTMEVRSDEAHENHSGSSNSIVSPSHCSWI